MDNLLLTLMLGRNFQFSYFILALGLFITFSNYVSYLHFPNTLFLLQWLHCDFEHDQEHRGTLEIKSWLFMGFSVTRLENDEMKWFLSSTIKIVFKGGPGKTAILLFPNGYPL